VGIEVAVRAFADTVRDMNVEGKRLACRHIPYLIVCS
jgi:hypothetical protein